MKNISIKLCLIIVALQVTTISQTTNNSDKENLSLHILNHNNKYAEFLIHHHSPDSLNNSSNFTNRQLPLFAAIYTGNIDMIQKLLAANADPNASGESGSPLQEAAKIGNIYIMEMLIENGAIFDSKTLEFALNAVGHDRYKNRLLWPGVDFSTLQENTYEARIRIVKNTITNLSTKLQKVLYCHHLS